MSLHWSSISKVGAGRDAWSPSFTLAGRVGLNALRTELIPGPLSAVYRPQAGC